MVKNSGLILLLLSSGVSSFSVTPKTSPAVDSSKNIMNNSNESPPLPTRTADLSVEEIHALVDTNGRQTSPVSLVTTLGTIVVGVPLALAVLPLTVLYQVGKSMVALVQTNDLSNLTPLDSGVTVSSNVVDRRDRKYDIVVMGASGFTGKLCVRHLAKTYGVNDKVKWAIAGRSQSKLDQVKKVVADELGNQKVLDVETIIVDTTKPSTLPGLVKDTRAVASTAGPFEKYGSPVVEACAKYGTHYSDITGETGWKKYVIKTWQSTAVKTGAKIVSLCGSDCIPWDLSLMAMDDALPKGEGLKKVVFVDDLVGAVSGGTPIATPLMGLENGSRQPLKPDKYLTLPYGSESDLKFHFEPAFVPTQLKEPGHHLNDYMGSIHLSMINADLFKRSVALRLRGKTTTFVYEEYQQLHDFKSGMTGLLGLVIGGILIMNPLTGYFAKRILPNPGEGPSLDDMQNNFLGCTTGYGEGTSGTKVEAVMYFPRCQGYLDTARMVTESALCLALDEEKLPTSEGGFWTPATGMGDALLQRLRTTGTYFAVKKT